MSKAVRVPLFGAIKEVESIHSPIYLMFMKLGLKQKSKAGSPLTHVLAANCGAGHHIIAG